MSSGEEWRPVTGWEELYEVSSLGRVRSLPRVKSETGQGKRKFWPGKIMNPASRHAGHLVVSLRDSPRHHSEYVHRIVANAFIPNPEGHPLVRHLDDNPKNNRVENLAWGTYSDNMQDRLRNNPPGQKTHCIRGHEFTPENTRIYKRVKVCKRCNTLLAREYKKRRKQG